MTLCSMFRRCPHCHRRYPYNPDVGDLGMLCPYCGRMNPWPFGLGRKEKPEKSADRKEKGHGFFKW